METNDIKNAMYSAVISEMEQWWQEKDGITNGYDFEEQLLQRVRKIGSIMLQAGVGEVPKNRNKKNFTRVWAK